MSKRAKGGKYSRKTTKNPMKIVAIVLGSLAALLVLIALAIGIFLWYSGSVRGDMFARRNTPTLVPETSAPADVPETTAPPVVADWIDEDGNAYDYREDVITILLMGVDYMADENQWEAGVVSNGGNADIMCLVTLDTKTFDFSLLYLPRDTMADVIAMDPEGNYIDTVRTNLSAAHSYGDGGDLSCRLTEDAVSRLLWGVPVNRYVALDYEGMYGLNSLLGGLTITFGQDYTQIDGDYVRGATVTMDSEQMRRFITYRDHSDVSGAYDRGVRGMAALRAIFDQCKAKIAENPTAALDLWNALDSYITSDLSLTEITYLATNIGKMAFGADTVVRLPGETKMGEAYAEFYPDEAWLHDFVVDTFCIPAGSAR